MRKVEETQKSQKKKVSSTLDPMNVLFDSDSTFLGMIWFVSPCGSLFVCNEQPLSGEQSLLLSSTPKSSKRMRESAGRVDVFTSAPLICSQPTSLSMTLPASFLSLWQVLVTNNELNCNAGYFFQKLFVEILKMHLTILPIADPVSFSKWWLLS